MNCSPLGWSPLQLHDYSLWFGELASRGFHSRSHEASQSTTVFITTASRQAVSLRHEMVACWETGYWCILAFAILIERHRWSLRYLKLTLWHRDVLPMTTHVMSFSWPLKDLKHLYQQYTCSTPRNDREICRCCLDVNLTLYKDNMRPTGLAVVCPKR